MTDPIRAALERLLARLDETTDPNEPVPAWSDSFYAACAALSADGPVVPEGREPAAVVTEPSHVELLGLMPEQFREDLATVSRMAAHGAGTGVTPGLFRVSLNTGALDFARAAIALDRSRRAPVQPAEGELAELVAALLADAECVEAEHYDLCNMTGGQMRRAADLLAQRHPAPVPVAERLPEPNTKVLAHYFNALGNGRTVCAIWVPAKSRDDDVDFADDNFTEYDEEDNKYYWPEGWYEAIENWDEYGWIKVCEGEVVYWQPLPKWPALPLPAGEAQP